MSVTSKLPIFVLLVVAIATLSLGQQWFDQDVEAWHYHTYYYASNTRSVNEAIAWRRILRQKINDGTFSECSLYRFNAAPVGPHLIAQFEMCCNKTSIPSASSFIVQNHGNLSVLLHPLTVYERADHDNRATWLGEKVVVDLERLPLQSPIASVCPVYESWPDIPTFL